MANAEDLNRLTSCSLVLLGHIFVNMGNSSEALNMVTPAMQLATKIPDVHVQLWASALLKGRFILSSLLFPSTLFSRPSLHFSLPSSLVSSPQPSLC
jgi:hypothetical protein